MDRLTARRLREWRREWAARTTLDPGDLDELREHLASTIDSRRREGRAEADAIDEALRRLGSPAVVAAEFGKAADVPAPPPTWMPDLRAAFRQLRANPGFTLIAASSIGIAIAVNDILEIQLQCCQAAGPGAKPDRKILLRRRRVAAGDILNQFA